MDTTERQKLAKAACWELHEAQANLDARKTVLVQGNLATAHFNLSLLRATGSSEPESWLKYRILTVKLRIAEHHNCIIALRMCQDPAYKERYEKEVDDCRAAIEKYQEELSNLEAQL